MTTTQHAVVRFPPRHARIWVLASLLALGNLVGACRDAAERAAQASDQRVRTMRLPEVRSARVFVPANIARVIVTPGYVGFDSAPLAATLESSEQRNAALNPIIPVIGMDDIENYAPPEDGRGPESLPALASATDALFTRSRRFSPAGVRGRAIDYFAESSAEWRVVKTMLRQAALSGFGAVGLGVRSHGSPAVMLYRFPQFAARRRDGFWDVGLKVMIIESEYRVGITAVDVRDIQRTDRALDELRNLLRERLAANDRQSQVWVQPDSTIPWSDVVAVMDVIFQVWEGREISVFFL
jgi:hypothetical protein